MTNDLHGTDLMVLPYLVAQDALPADLATVRQPIRGTALKASASEAIDLASFSGRENLAQALILRLLTSRGSLAELGHSTYGSRLYELIGQRKTEALRHLCRAYVLEVVAQEPRVEPKAVALSFDVQAETPSTFVFTLAVQPKGGSQALSLDLEVGI